MLLLNSRRERPPCSLSVGPTRVKPGETAAAGHWLDSDNSEGFVTLAQLIYTVITSLDGYIEDETGSFDWAEPDEEVHTFINDLERPVGTYLLGRRMYETMVFWETAHTLVDEPPTIYDFAAVWQAADKIVYSQTLEAATSARTRIEHSFDPESVRQLKARAERDLSIGGPELAAQAFRAGLVDECQLFIVPIVVGGGKPALPDGIQLQLELLDERRFGNGTIYLRYRTTP
jgi:dihydrofolate reductase